MNLRSPKEIIEEIKSLVDTTGFIYTLCLILVEDFHLNAEEMHEVDFRARLNKNEISLLIGFLIQKEISLEKPKHPLDLISLKKKTRKIMDELHSSTMIPSINKFRPIIDNLKEGNDINPSKEDFFGGEDVFIEPIFYSGDGIYDFQYIEYLNKKYKYDEKWLNENTNFYFDEVVEIANILFNNESWEDYPCQKDIVQGAYNVCSPITNLFQDIFEGNTSADVEFFVDPNYINYAVTEGTFAPERIPITFGLNSLEGSDILMTTVAIHEIFHANLYYIFKVNSEDSDPSNDFNIPQNSNPTYAELVEAFASLETGSSSSTIQHNFIANYKNQIAQGVYNWAVTQGGYSESNNLLEDLKKLAWVGLKDTDLWNHFEINPFNQNEVSEINSIISHETVDQGYAIGNFCN
ncbi:hypothetical protein ULMA_20560 [Patiriisocius marinus]|uniref:Uncharacterized protein n=1 Tax=Patiriisocius marinus TaxID=1397112 RepID=A0A5J4J1R7_9FLAO|nr:hypothetical protein [Patiriisocius marinus]GER59948.1 hypothetical protein ULMA_20560 [Patiriisocius marinus]